MIRLYLRYFSFLIYLIARLWIHFQPVPARREKTLLIIKPDAVGDYILMRNFLPYIRKSSRFRYYRITWCGNALHKTFFEQFDRGWVDEFIWIEKTRIYWDIFYYLRIAKSLYQQYDVTLHPVFSREFLFDYFVKIAGVSERIGIYGDTININPAYHRIANKWYTQLFQIKAPVVFEFEKNKHFFSWLLNQEIQVVRPFFEPDLVQQIELPPLPGSFVVLFPGAQMSFRRWSPEKFAAITDFIQSEFKMDVIIAGGKLDERISGEIIRYAKTEPKSMVGKTTFSQLIGIIAQAKLVITNDTAAAHVAPALDVPVIALSQLNHYSRFLPYPPESQANMICLVPPGFSQIPEEKLVEKFKAGSVVSINLITPDHVKQAIRQILGTKNPNDRVSNAPISEM
jgi:ADP-heptose:LPS heptosyltransferase